MSSKPYKLLRANGHKSSVRIQAAAASIIIIIECYHHPMVFFFFNSNPDLPSIPSIWHWSSWAHAVGNSIQIYWWARGGPPTKQYISTAMILIQKSYTQIPRVCLSRDYCSHLLCWPAYDNFNHCKLYSQRKWHWLPYDIHQYPWLECLKNV